MIFNHITVKVPGDEPHFLINPYGLHYSEVKASNLVKVDIDGNIVEQTDYAVNPAGMVIHSAIHAARPDLTALLTPTPTRAWLSLAPRKGCAMIISIQHYCTIVSLIMILRALR